MGSIPTRGSDYQIPGRASGSIDRLKVMMRLLNLWDKHPSVRLTQLIENARGGDKGTLPDDSSFYHYEDFDFIKALEEFYET